MPTDDLKTFLKTNFISLLQTITKFKLVEIVKVKIHMK